MSPRDLFLRGVWTLIPSDQDTTWVTTLAAQPLTHQPLGDFGPLIQGMLDKGVSPRDIARLARIIGYETAFALLYHLEDPDASYATFPPGAPRVYWSGLQAFDAETDQPLEELNSLHESLLTADPTGQEMRPPTDGDAR
jgi:hypothetical protein